MIFRKQFLRGANAGFFLGGLKKLTSLIIFSGLVSFLTISLVYASDIDREGNIQVPSKETAIAICKKNPYIDTNMLLAACVKQEQEGAKEILVLLRGDRDATSEAYWNCVKNEYIDTYMLLSACISQELEAMSYLREGN